MKYALSVVAALTLSSPQFAAAQTAMPISFVDQQNGSEVLGSDFVGTSVVTSGGENIGKVANLVFDQTGHIELAVIGVGGFLGIGAKEVAVPFESLKSDIQNSKHVFVIDTTKDQLAAAPGFKTLNDQAFNQRIAGWREKATASWQSVKERAEKAYDTAKEKVGEATQPKPQPAPVTQQ